MSGQLLLRLATRLLPASTRARYRREFAAELDTLQGAARRKYSRSVLAHSWQLRTALVGAEPAKPLRCKLGQHHWVIDHNPDGEPFQRCSLCGEDRGESIVPGYAAGNAALNNIVLPP